MDGLIGKSIDRVLVKDILKSLDIHVASDDEKGLVAVVPTNKVDVTRPCDVIEEILRIYGYDNVEISDTVKSCLNQTTKPDRDKIQNIVSDYLAANGFNETKRCFSRRRNPLPVCLPANSPHSFPLSTKQDVWTDHSVW